MYQEEEEEEEETTDKEENPTKVYQVSLTRGHLKCIGSIGQEETWCKHIPAVTQFRTDDINNETARIMRELIYSTW